MEARVGNDAVQCTLQLTDIGAKVLGDKEGYIVAQGNFHDLCFLLQNGHSHFEFRGFNLDGKPPVETGNETIFETLDILWISVAGDDDLLLGFDQGIEGKKELFLGAILAIEKLDVVDDQHVKGTVVAFESVEGLLLVGAHHIGDVIVGVHVPNDLIGTVTPDLIAKGVNQVGFAETNPAVDTEGAI